ncbi:MAG: S41 family peptidase [Candidatus Omnitrophica bacterium]|nr:S41 family peptidase [Candidatus Omnitrophota bacterium]MDD5488752.1 S41 family peptidase [Candidatus Omnitrophota bacterium]
MDLRLSGKKVLVTYIVLVSVITAAVSLFLLNRAAEKEAFIPEYQKPYLDFLKKVFDIMDESYYKPVSREVYEEFRKEYITGTLSNIKDRTRKIDRFAQLGAGLLVTKLRDPEDTFTNFIPPEMAEKYKQEIYSYDYGLGVSGRKVDAAFMVDNVNPRSDAYAKGLRQGNIILGFNDITIQSMTDQQIDIFLHPPIDTIVKIQVANVADQKIITYDIKSVQYYTETISRIETGIPGVYYFKINTFNRETADDFRKYLEKLGVGNIKYMVLDLAGNPGGPPLAVRELSGMLLPPGQKLFYYKKKNVPEFGLVSPESDIYYTGPLLVVEDSHSGSASELLAAVLKGYKRAVIIGKEPTAGFAFLKSAVDFDDGSMLAMITGDAYLFDGTLLDRSGVVPDIVIPQDVDNVEKYVIEQIGLKILSELAAQQGATE